MAIKQAQESFGPISVRPGSVSYNALIHSCNNPVTFLSVWKDKWPSTPWPEVCGNKSCCHPMLLAHPNHTRAQALKPGPLLMLIPFIVNYDTNEYSSSTFIVRKGINGVIRFMWKPHVLMAVPHKRFDWSFVTLASPTRFCRRLACVKLSGTKDRESGRRRLRTGQEEWEESLSEK